MQWSGEAAANTDYHILLHIDSNLVQTLVGAFSESSGCDIFKSPRLLAALESNVESRSLELVGLPRCTAEILTMRSEKSPF